VREPGISPPEAVAEAEAEAVVEEAAVEEAEWER